MKVMVGLSDIFAIVPLIIIFLGSLVPLTVKLILKKEQNPLMSLTQAISSIFLAGTWLALASKSEPKMYFANAISVDGLSTTTSLLILFITAISLVISLGNVNTKGEHFSEYIFIMMNAAVGMMTLVSSNDFIVTFIGIEIMSLASYILVAMSHEQRLSKEAAFKYFVLGSFASAVLLYGIAFIFGTTGSTSYTVLREVGATLIQNRLFMLGWLLILAGFFFKISIFPFHTWTPDVYQGAPTPVTAFMSTGVKLAGFIALLRIVLAKDFTDTPNVLMALQWLAVLTMMVGNIGAIMQDNFKRMLAYSSVAHSGYAFVGLIVSGTGANPEGASSVVFYLFTYAFMNLGAFALVSLFEKYEETSLNIDDLKGLATRNPWLAFGLTIFLVSLAGIPPTAGFFSKFFILSVAISQGFYWLAVWTVLASVISVYFYLRPIVVMYMKEGQAEEVLDDSMGKWAVGLAAAMLIIIGLGAQPFIQRIQVSVLTLFN